MKKFIGPTSLSIVSILLSAASAFAEEPGSLIECTVAHSRARDKTTTLRILHSVNQVAGNLALGYVTAALASPVRYHPESGTYNYLFRYSATSEQETQFTNDPFFVALGYTPKLHTWVDAWLSLNSRNPAQSSVQYTERSSLQVSPFTSPAPRVTETATHPAHCRVLSFPTQ